MSKDQLTQQQRTSIRKMRNALREKSKDLLDTYPLLGITGAKNMDAKAMSDFLAKKEAADTNYFKLSSTELGNYTTRLGYTFNDELEKIQKKDGPEEGRVNAAQILQYMMIWSEGRSEDGKLFDLYLVRDIAKALPKEVARNPMLLHRAMCLLTDPDQRDHNFIAAYNATKAIYEAVAANKGALLKEYKEEERVLGERLSYVKKAAKFSEDALQNAIDDAYDDAAFKRLDELQDWEEGAKRELARIEKAFVELELGAKRLSKRQYEERKEGLEKEKAQVVADLDGTPGKPGIRAKLKVAWENVKPLQDKIYDLQRLQLGKPPHLDKHMEGELSRLQKRHAEYRALLDKVGNKYTGYGSVLDSTLKPGSKVWDWTRDQIKDEALSQTSTTGANVGRVLPKLFFGAGIFCLACAAINVIVPVFVPNIMVLGVTVVSPGLAPGFAIAFGALLLTAGLTVIIQKISSPIAGVLEGIGGGVKKAAKWIGTKVQGLAETKDKDKLLDEAIELEKPRQISRRSRQEREDREAALAAAETHSRSGSTSRNSRDFSSSSSSRGSDDDDVALPRIESLNSSTSSSRSPSPAPTGRNPSGATSAPIPPSSPLFPTTPATTIATSTATAAHTTHAPTTATPTPSHITPSPPRSPADIVPPATIGGLAAATPPTKVTGTSPDTGTGETHTAKAAAKTTGTPGAEKTS